MRRLTASRPDYLVVTAAIVALALAVALALVLPGLAAKVVGVLTAMAITYAAKTPVRRLLMERRAKKYRDFVAEDPVRLFYVKPPVDSPALDSRSRLMASITDELLVQRRDGERRPILVVGEAGSGKTTFAAGLARRLASAGRVPVIVSLRDHGDEINFDTEGRKRFAEIVDRFELARGGDALWDYLRRSGRCVVIADGLDERVLDSRAGRVTEVTAEILAAEPARSIPLVVTSRPDGLRDAQLIEAVWLENLPEGYVASLLASDCRHSLGEHESREITRRLELTTRPLFLTVARDIGKADPGGRPSLLASFVGEEDTDLARYRLLDTRLDIFMSDAPDIRRRSIDTVSVLALIALCRGDTRASVAGQEAPQEQWLRQVAGAALDRREAIGAATDLRFLRIEGDSVGFRHPIIQTYLASRGIELIRRSGFADPEWAPLLEAGTTDEVLRALRMYATRLAVSGGGSGAEDRIQELVRDLVARAESEQLTANQRLALLATAAQALGSACAGCDGALERERADLARLVASTWEVDCPQATKVEAIKWLARMSGEAAFRSAWAIALEDDSYAFRWAVVEAMAESGVAATAPLRGIVQPLLDSCVSWTQAADSPDEALPEDLLRQLSIVAKFLPSGNEAGADTAGAGLDSPAAADLTSSLGDAVRAMTARERALGVEASLAQGLKHAARRYPLTHENLAEAEKLVHGARFWYTRVMGVHALVRHAVAIEDTRLAEDRADDAVNRVDECMAAALEDEHPWVREAAAQGRSAVEHVRRRDTDAARAFVWHDESSQISRSSHELDDAASRLLGDVALVLNMNEQGVHAVLEDGRLVPHSTSGARVPGCEKCQHQLEVGTNNSLPHCLTRDPDRGRILDPQQRCSCSFKLCPYDFRAYREGRHAHRGQLSPQFCASQRVIARNLGPPPWQREMSVESYVDFWGTMEQRGQDGGGG